MSPDGKKFAFHLIPCGIIYPHTVNVLGNGVVVDFEKLWQELADLEKKGVNWKGRLLISDRAHILFQSHRARDGFEEERRKSDGRVALGTTRRGIGPAYADKVSRVGIRVGALLNWDVFCRQLRQCYQSDETYYNTLDWFKRRLDVLQPMIIDSVTYLNDASKAGKSILTEGANAAMLDVDFGTYPFVTSSTTTAGGVCTGLGLAPSKLTTVYGVAKAYTTRVGAGPFPTELTDERGGGNRPLGAPGTDIGLHMQTVGKEVGVTTGRKRRCGWLDVVVLNYSNLLNGYSSINLTKLDVMDGLDEVKIGAWVGSCACSRLRAYV